jgi:hypothetical protein
VIVWAQHPNWGAKRRDAHGPRCWWVGNPLPSGIDSSIIEV